MTVSLNECIIYDLGLRVTSIFNYMVSVRIIGGECTNTLWNHPPFVRNLTMSYRCGLKRRYETTFKSYIERQIWKCWVNIHVLYTTASMVYRSSCSSVLKTWVRSVVVLNQTQKSWYVCWHLLFLCQWCSNNE